MVSSDNCSAPAPPIHARGRISQQTTFRRWRQFGGKEAPSHPSPLAGEGGEMLFSIELRFNFFGRRGSHFILA